MNTPAATSLQQAVSHHPRRYLANDFVYPVISRRAHGLSIGVNLNVDTLCNFDCVYCQVDRSGPTVPKTVTPEAVEQELRATLAQVESGELWTHPRFAAVPEEWRRLNDIALSGDGEPTTYLRFAEVCRVIAAVKRDLQLDTAKVVVITNGSGLHRTSVIDGLDCLAPVGLEVWAKLEAGTEAYYQRVERTKVPFDLVLRNILAAARRWPVVIQSLFMRLDGTPPDEAEIAAFVGQLEDVRAGGGAIDRVQVYTVARPPAESYVSALDAEHVARIADAVHAAGFAVEQYVESGD